MEKVTFRGKEIALYTNNDVMDLATEVVEDNWPHAIPEQSISGFGYMNFEVSRARGVSCRIGVSFHNMRIEESEEMRIGLTDPTVQVNWRGGSCGLAEAMANVALYQEMISLAALIECRLAEIQYVGKVVWTKEEEAK